MKNKILLTLLVLLLCACSNTANTTNITVNEPLEYSVNIKDNAEFILIKEGTSVDEATQIILDNLDIQTNADSYEFDWIGEAASMYTREELEKTIINGIKIEFWSANATIDYEKIKETTLNYDSFRPIELAISFTKNNVVKTYYKQILLCVAENDEYSIIQEGNAKIVENAYKEIYFKGKNYSMIELENIAKDQGYFSNLKKGYETVLPGKLLHMTGETTYIYYHVS